MSTRPAAGGGGTVRVSMTSVAAEPTRENEDFTGAIPTAAVLIDGAGIPGSAAVCRHGVAWYARRLGASLLGALGEEPDRGLASLCADAIEQVTDAHRRTCRVADPVSPSATVLAVRWGEAEIEYLLLGDSVLVLEQRDGRTEVICDRREVIISRSYAAELARLDVRSTRYHQLLAELRSQRNRSGGFWVAKDDPRAAAEAIVGRSAISRSAGVVLLSNGASRLVDRFGLLDWPTFAAQLAVSDGAAMIRRVRTEEAARGVAPDDATITRCTHLDEPVGRGDAPRPT